ncbi:MAG: ABC transporter permease [Bacilli bacterium]|jgi:spermidine/putrescine transport system permease protein|nr:ABC transporter permease [Bacilli bacterium]
MKRFKALAIPYFVWLVFLVVLPIIVMLVLTFMSSNGMDFSSAQASLDAYARLADPSILKAIWNSLVVAFWTVIICIALGYPTAYFISFSNLKNKMLFLLLLILPMWSNSMLRIVSWLRLFSTDGLAALNLIGTNPAVIFVTVTTYLPFMIFPIYTVLEKMDRSLMEASKDLGVPAWKTFLKVTLPLSMSGVSSGIIMVFLPAATGFAISQTIGQGKVRLIGNLIQSVFEKNNYNFGALLSILLSIIIIAIVVVFEFLQHGKKERKEK